jgi:hypothetical protein
MPVSLNNEALEKQILYLVSATSDYWLLGLRFLKHTKVRQQLKHLFSAL